MINIEHIIIFLSLFLFAFLLSFTVAYKILYKHFRKGNSYLINRHIEDMQIYITTNHRVKVLERRIKKVINALRQERQSKKEILNVLDEGHG